MSTKISVGLLGATGIVGQRFVQMLEDHPWFEVAWLAASDRSEGRPYGEAARWKRKTAIPARVAQMQVSPAKPDGAPKVIFAALDASIAAELEPQFADAGCAVITNSGSQSRPREIAGVPGLAAEIGRLRRDQSQLLGHRFSHGPGAFGSAIWSSDRNGRNDAGSEWRGLSGCGIARYSRQRDSLHRQGRRKNGRRDAQAARPVERLKHSAGSVWHERAVQSGRG